MYPCKQQFYNIKVGFKGVKISWWMEFHAVKFDTIRQMPNLPSKIVMAKLDISKLLSGNKILTIIMDHNSVVNLWKLTHKIPNL